MSERHPFGSDTLVIPFTIVPDPAPPPRDPAPSPAPSAPAPDPEDAEA